MKQLIRQNLDATGRSRTLMNDKGIIRNCSFLRLRMVSTNGLGRVYRTCTRLLRICRKDEGSNHPSTIRLFILQIPILRICTDSLDFDDSWPVSFRSHLWPTVDGIALAKTKFTAARKKTGRNRMAAPAQWRI
jgi:hypothetical protein